MPTSRPPLQVLILAQERDEADRLIRELVEVGFDVEATVVANAREFRGELAHDHDLVLAHHGLAGLDAFEALGMLRSSEHDIPLVAFGGSMSPEDLAECLRLGAVAYLPADQLVRLGETVQRVLDERDRDGDGMREADGQDSTTEGEPAGSTEDERVARLEATVARLLALQRVDRAAGAATDLRFALGSIVALVLEETGAGAGAIWVYEKATGSLRRYAGQRTESAGSYESLPAPPAIILGEGAVGECALRREPLRLVGDEVAAGTGEGEQGAWREYVALPLEVEGRLQGVLEAFSDRMDPLTGDELEFLEEVAPRAAVAIERTRRFRELESSSAELAAACDATVEAWARALDLRDDETEGHSGRVTEFTVALARHLGVEEVELAHMRRGALLHDIGKLGVADSIFTKPGALSSGEREDMQRHPELAKELLEAVDFLEPALAIPWCHHENWDGSGYPRGLRGEEIPLPARIFAVADVYDALTSARPYRSAWTDDAARRFIEERSGRQFDPLVVKAFLEILPALAAIRG